jgi:hypothetical protein
MVRRRVRSVGSATQQSDDYEVIVRMTAHSYYDYLFKWAAGLRLRRSLIFFLSGKEERKGLSSHAPLMVGV